MRLNNVIKMNFMLLFSEVFRLRLYGTIVGFTLFDLDVLKNRLGFDLDVWFMVLEQVNLTKYQIQSRFNRERNESEIYDPIINTYNMWHISCNGCLPQVGSFYFISAYSKEVSRWYHHTSSNTILWIHNLTIVVIVVLFNAWCESQFSGCLAQLNRAP